MGIIRAFTDAVGGTLADQWKEALTAAPFDEHVVVAPGVQRGDSRGRGVNTFGEEGVITNGSKIFVPENTAAFIFCQSAIEDILTEPGEYEFSEGQGSIFNGDSFASSIVEQVKDRIAYGGIAPNRKQVAFVNLREIRDIKFGTRGPQVYNDRFYGADLEVFAYGKFSIQICDIETFVRKFIPPGVYRYSFDDKNARSQIVAEFMQSLIVALNSLSSEYRIAQLPSQANSISQAVINDDRNAGTWPERFGFELRSVAIENIEFTPESRELVQQYASTRMNVSAYENVSQQAANMAAQQKIAEGIQNNGLGDGGGMIFGMNMAQAIDPRGVVQNVQQPQQTNAATFESQPSAQAAGAQSDGPMSLSEQVSLLKDLKELLDLGVLTQEEFDAKKKEIMGA